MLPFPPKHHVLTARLAITDIPALVAEVRRDVARILREMATEESPEVATRLREIAMMFDVPITTTPRCDAVPIRPEPDRP